ncbi:MAG TPA: sigma-70 family RNA polymerase sigma factor [Actinomycetota bacterium]|nr:sigma-70 family RNA polymerase sigma factor [Actinomycetota bacterium]
MLLDGITRSDDDAFAELFRRYGPQCLGLATRVVADRTLAEEIVQDVFLGVWKAASRYDPARGTVRGWVMMQVHHRAVDVVRREQAERRRNSNQLPPVNERDVEDVVEESWMAARRQQVRAAMNDLPEEQRTVLELAYFEGMTQAQVAAHTGLPLGTVKSRTLAAMRKLNQSLAEARAT